MCCEREFFCLNSLFHFGWDGRTTGVGLARAPLPQHMLMLPHRSRRTAAVLRAASRSMYAAAGYSGMPFTVHRGTLKTAQITYEGFSGEVPFTLVLPEAYDPDKEGGHPLLVCLAGPGMPDTMILEPQQVPGPLPMHPAPAAAYCIDASMPHPPPPRV